MNSLVNIVSSIDVTSDNSYTQQYIFLYKNTPHCLLVYLTLRVMNGLRTALCTVYGMPCIHRPHMVYAKACCTLIVRTLDARASFFLFEFLFLSCIYRCKSRSHTHTDPIASSVASSSPTSLSSSRYLMHLHQRPDKVGKWVSSYVHHVQGDGTHWIPVRISAKWHR